MIPIRHIQTAGHHASDRTSDHENDVARWRAASIRYFARLPLVILTLSLIVDGVGATSPLAAQAGPGIKTTVISGEPTCERCEIERTLLATIHDRSFPGGALVTGGAVHVNRDGTFLVRAGPRLGELFLADESGAIIRQIGRQGEGPGEYLRPLSVHELPQAFVVFDPTLGRVTWLARDNLEVTRTARMPAVNMGTAPAVFSDGSYVLRATLPTRSGIGLPLHLVTADGDVVRSFGQDSPPAIIAPSGDSAVWAAQVDRYRVERWHIDGRLLAVLQREVDWFPSPADDDSQQAGDLSFQLSGISEDQQGRLWVHTSIRTLREVRGVDATTGQERSVLRLSPDPATAQEVIEVLDPVTGVVIASRRILGSDGRAADGIAAKGSGFYQEVHRLGEQGTWLIDIWETRLKF